MVQVPEDKVTEKDLAEWFKLAAELKALRASEMTMRKRIVKAFFPNPKEGSNKTTLSDGYVLEMTQPIERSIDVAALDALGEQLDEANVPTDALLKYKPSLVVSSYRNLTPEQLEVFDQVLTIKPGSPSGMKVTKPKDKS